MALTIFKFSKNYSQSQTTTTHNTNSIELNYNYLTVLSIPAITSTMCIGIHAKLGFSKQKDILFTVKVYLICQGLSYLSLACVLYQASIVVALTTILTVWRYVYPSYG